MEENGIINNNNIVSFLLQCTFTCWLITKVIGWKLWVSDRQFPLIPPFEFLQAPAAVHWLLLVMSALLLILLIFKPLNKFLLIFFLFTELASCLLDQNRWQAWEYQYLFITVAAIINYNHPQKLIGCIALIMAGTYLYSGIGKLNPGYLEVFWDKMVLKRFFRLENVLMNYPVVYYCGYITALLEVIAAAGLFFVSTQKISAAVLISMHVGILILLGPFGLDYNRTVWPWNVLMIIFLYIIFLHKKNSAINLSCLWKGWNKMIIICWGILPALNYIGLWDNYLSSRIYSGNLPQMVMCINDTAEVNILKPYLNKGDVYNICNGSAMVNVQRWAMKEMNSPPYPELRVYKKIKEHWMKFHTGSTATVVYFFPAGNRQIKIIEQ